MSSVYATFASFWIANALVEYLACLAFAVSVSVLISAPTVSESRKWERFAYGSLGVACLLLLAFEVVGGSRALRGRKWSFEDGDVDVLVIGRDVGATIYAFENEGYFASALGPNGTLEAAIADSTGFSAWILVVPDSLRRLPDGFVDHVERAIDDNRKVDVVKMGGSHDPWAVVACRRRRRRVPIVSLIAECEAGSLTCEKHAVFDD